MNKIIPNNKQTDKNTNICLKTFFLKSKKKQNQQTREIKPNLYADFT